MKLNAKQLQIMAWTITGVVVAVAVIAWGEGIRWRFSSLNSYQLFPLFGLLAFSLMWAHYMMAAMRQYYGIDKKTLRQYFEISSLLVLVAIILHPGLLAWQLWQVGLGLPPGSYLQFVGDAARLSVIGGIIAWLAFMAYELRRVYETRSWWRFVQLASDIAILLIFFHALRLGGELQVGWFRVVWFGYGISLVLALSYMYANMLGFSAKKTKL